MKFHFVNFYILQKWFHGKSEWQKNPEISTLWISRLWVGNTDLKGSSSANRKETHGSYQQSMMLDQAQLPKNLAITNYWWRDMAKMFWKNRLWSAAEWIWLTFSSWISYSKIRLLQRFELLYSEIVSSGNLVNSRWYHFKSCTVHSFATVLFKVLISRKICVTELKRRIGFCYYAISSDG